MDMGNLPEWVPFACMVSNKVIRKPMIARIIEGLTIAAVGVVAALFVGLPVAMERVDAKIQYTSSKLEAHESWAKMHVDKRDREMIEARRVVEMKNEEIMRLLASIDQCLRERTCTK